MHATAAAAATPVTCCTTMQMQYYQADEKQYRFFRRMGDAFVRVGLLNDTSGNTSAAYFPGSCLALPNQDVSDTR
jgi:hypothetical protein